MKFLENYPTATMVFANPFDKARMKVDNAFSSTRTALEQARTVGEKALTASGVSIHFDA